MARWHPFLHDLACVMNIFDVQRRREMKIVSVVFPFGEEMFILEKVKRPMKEFNYE